jgi:hypothetical protein
MDQGYDATPSESPEVAKRKYHRRATRERRAAGKRFNGVVNLADVGPGDHKARLLAWHGIDQRTIAYKETKQLIIDIENDLGGADRLSAAQRQVIQHAAVLGAHLTDREVRYLGGAEINVTEYCSLINAQRRCFEVIGVERKPRDVSPDLHTYLKSGQPEPRSEVLDEVEHIEAPRPDSVEGQPQ